MAASVRRVVLQALLSCSLVASCTGDCRDYVKEIEAKINGSSHSHFITVTEGETVSIPCTIHYFNSGRSVPHKTPQWHVQTNKYATFYVVTEKYPLEFARLEMISDNRTVMTLENLNSPNTVIALRCGVSLSDPRVLVGVNCMEMDKHTVVVTVVKKEESTTTREVPTRTNSTNTTSESTATDDNQKPTTKDPCPTIASVELPTPGKNVGTAAPLPSWFPLAICSLLGTVIALVLLVLTLIIFIAHSMRRTAKLLEQTQDGRASTSATNSRAEHYKNPAVDEDHSSHSDSAGTTALPP